MMARKILARVIIAASIVLALAAYLASLDLPYPVLQGLPFAGWVAVAIGCLLVILIPGLAVVGMAALMRHLTRRRDLTVGENGR